MDAPPDSQIATHAWTRATARAFDAFAQKELLIPGELLMENAGAAVARAVLETAREYTKKRAVVVCGTGNNGGDGFVAARHLFGTLQIEIWIVGAVSAIAGDARKNLERVQLLHIPIMNIPPNEDKRVLLNFTDSVIVDALFGTGLQRAVDGVYKYVIEAMNASGGPVVAVDIPSGLDADSGHVLGEAARAETTVTFVANKTGFFQNDGPARVGNVILAGIGAPVAPFLQFKKTNNH